MHISYIYQYINVSIYQSIYALLFSQAAFSALLTHDDGTDTTNMGALECLHGFIDSYIGHDADGVVTAMLCAGGRALTVALLALLLRTVLRAPGR